MMHLARGHLYASVFCRPRRDANFARRFFVARRDEESSVVIGWGKKVMWVGSGYNEKMAMILVVGVIVADWLLRNWLGWKNFKKCRCNRFYEDDSQNDDIR